MGTAEIGTKKATAACGYHTLTNGTKCLLNAVVREQNLWKPLKIKDISLLILIILTV